MANKKIVNALFLIIFFFLVITLPILGQPTATSPFILDEARIVSPFHENKIHEEAQRFLRERGTGIQIVTRGFDRLEDYPAAADKYFLDWMEKGNPHKRGILFFIALKNESPDGKVNIRFGAGLKDIIQEADLAGVLSQISEKNLADQDGAGLYLGVAKLIKILEKNIEARAAAGGPAAPPVGSSSNAIFWYLGATFALLLFFLYLFLKGENCPRCHKRLQVTIENSQGTGGHQVKRKILQCHHCGFIRRKKEILAAPAQNEPQSAQPPPSAG